jgi:hypothetical protein
MLNIRSLVTFGLLCAVEALPGSTLESRAKNKATGGQKQQTAQQQAAQIPQGVSKATDGGTILDMTATVK